MQVPVTKVKPWGNNQGDFVEINTSDFDPEKFELYEPEEKETKHTVAELKAILDQAGVAYEGGIKKADLQTLVNALAE